MLKIQKNVLLAPYTTFKVGGLAKYFAEAETAEEIQKFCGWARDKNTPVFVLGGGSNILISDKGFDGLVIKIKDSSNQDIEFWPGPKDSKVTKIWAGMPLASLVSKTIFNNLAGLEWAIEISGTVGGAIAGNTGAFGQSISDSIKKIEVFDMGESRIKNYELGDCDFAYRDSVFSASDGRNNSNLIILSAVLGFKKEKAEVIEEKLKNNLKQRTSAFSDSAKCAGSFFKNIEWKRKDIDKVMVLKKFPDLKQFANKPKISAGFLIESVGLKGERIGNAMVSDKHANFILNLDNTKTEEIIMLSALIKSRINAHYGFNLEEEVRLIGF